MNIQLLLMIVRREDSAAYSQMLERLHPGGVVSLPCEGSSKIEQLRMLGIEETGRLLFAAVMESSRVRQVLTRAIMNLGLTIPGHGIAITIPLESIGGKSSLKRMTGMESINTGEGSAKALEDRQTASMIIAVIENGHVDSVMDVARSAGASGGTVVHAKGTAGEMVRRFFGVTLGQEKEIVMIVAKLEQRAAIMRAIMEKAGVNSPAHTVMFSVPVEQVVGIHSFETAKSENDA